MKYNGKKNLNGKKVQQKVKMQQCKGKYKISKEQRNWIEDWVNNREGKEKSKWNKMEK